MVSLNIIKKNSDYRRVYSHGKTVADRFIVLYFLPNNTEQSRFGFTVSKKVGNVVTRNRIRRLFREACRLNCGLFPTGFDFVLLARREIVGSGYHEVEASLLKLLKRLKFDGGCSL
jgi:ribonuclease P protein component